MRTVMAGLAAMSSFCVGCAGGPGSVQGNLNGEPFEVAETLSITAVAGSRSVGFVVLSSRAGLCNALGSNTDLEDRRLLIIGVGFAGSSNFARAPNEPGVFPVVSVDEDQLPNNAIAGVGYHEIDERCDVAALGFGSSGSISISSIGDDGAYAGSGDVVLDNGDSITVEFSGTPCAALSGFAYTSPKSLTCE